MPKWLAASLVLLATLSTSARAVDLRVEPLKGAPPDGQLSAEIVAQLSPQGFKILQGEKRTLCEIWPARQWDAKAGFTPTDAILYPLKVGSLVAVIRFPRKAADFRDQEIASGIYTLRYGNQPVDGNHVGTFPTRDFLLMLPATADTSPAPIAEADLFKTSAQAAGSGHPAIMPLVKAEDAGELPAVRHLEEQDWWTVQFGGKDAQGGKLALELIVSGKAAE